MGAFKDFARGLGASLSGHGLIALGWIYAGCLAVTFVFTVLVFRFVAATVDHSAMAAELRGGQGAAWAVDLIGQGGTSASIAALTTAAMVLIPVYLVLSVFFSGGMVSKVRAALGHSGPERFLAASARYAGAMSRIAALEVVVIGVLGAILVFGVAASAVADVGHALPWVTLAVALLALALVTSVFDYARVRLVARDDGSARSALADAFRLIGRQPLAFLVLALLTGGLGLVVVCVLVWLHSVVALDTGVGVLLGLVIGQLGIVGRLWSRLAAYGAESSLAERTWEVGVT